MSTIKFKHITNVVVTAYNPGDKNQCSGKTKEELNTGAWGDKVEHGDIAVSPDLLKYVKKGDYICLKFTDSIHCGIVKDKMDKREKKIDLAIKRKTLKQGRKEAKEFGRVKAKLYVMKEKK